MARQCLARRIPDREQLCRETGAWQAKRNRESVSVDWRFKTEGCSHQAEVAVSVNPNDGGTLA